MRVRRYLPGVRSTAGTAAREKIKRQLRWPAMPTAKSENREPKTEGNPKAEIRMPAEPTEKSESEIPMANQTEQRKEYAYLVRELEAFCGRKYPSDVDRRYREALEKRLYQLLPDLDVPALVRIVEATCGVDFPSAVDRNFHDQVMERLGRAHHLKDVRKVEIPGHWVNDRKGRAMPAPAVMLTGKSETRDPKAEGNPKAENRK